MSDIKDDIVKFPDLPVIEIVDDLVQVFKEFMVVNAALKLGLFSWLSENGPATSEQISTGTGIKPEYMPGLLGTLYYLDMVRKSGDAFSISPAAQLNFVRSSKYYQGDYLLNFQKQDSPWLSLDVYLTDPDKKKTFDAVSTESTKALAEYSLRGTIQNVINALKTWGGFMNAGRFLEIGGGDGLYAIAACQNNPQLKATAICGTPDKSVALEYIDHFGMKDRITVTSGDLLSGNYSGYDIILTSHSLYQYQERLEEIFSSVESALSDNGLFISNHWFFHPSMGTGMQGLYELELALHNHYHQLSNREAFEELCRRHNLQLLQAGIIRSQYGESFIHMAEKKKL